MMSDSIIIMLLESEFMTKVGWLSLLYRCENWGAYILCSE